MSYLQKRIADRRRMFRSAPTATQTMAGLGDLNSIVNSVGGALGTSIDIASDPYLSEVVCRIGQLKQIHAGDAPGACQSLPDDLQGGVGLARAVKPMRAYVWMEQRKWAYFVAAAAILGVPFLVGYDVGKGKR